MCFAYVACWKCLHINCKSTCKTCRIAWLRGRGTSWRYAWSWATWLRLPMLEKRIRPSLRHQRWLRPPLRVPDMLTVMQRTLRTGGPNYEDILRELDDYMRPGNHVFPSDWCGEGARRLLLMQQASHMSLSLSETFAYLTSTTACTEEAADVLQTFRKPGKGRPHVLFLFVDI